MPTIKIYPPQQLPDRKVSETQFNIWIEELEVYLSQEESLRLFLPSGQYQRWEAYEENAGRIVNAVGDDVDVNEDVTTANLEKRRRDLRTFLSIIGKCVSSGHYAAVVKHSTSMESIYAMLRRDYDIQQKGIHFLNILDLKYDSASMTPVVFYNQYRTMIVNNLAARDDVIKYKNNYRMPAAETMSPMIEDMILLNVIREIDIRLPEFIKLHYAHKMKDSDRLMDFKTDMLNNIQTFLNELDKEEQLNMIRGGESRLKAFQVKRNSNNQRKNVQRPASSGNQDKFCKLCYAMDKPRSIFKSHDIGDEKCKSITSNERKKLLNGGGPVKMGAIANLESVDGEESDNGANEQEVDDEDDQVNSIIPDYSPNDYPRSDGKLNYIRPVPTQILTVFYDSNCNTPLHIDLDSGANLNYVRKDEAIKKNYNIKPNGQLSTLGDGKSKLPAIGEIDETFYRNNWTVRYRAVVTEDLQAPYIGGTVFMVDNNIQQDLSKGVIHLHNRKYTVEETNCHSILPIIPNLKNQVHTKPPNLIAFKSLRVLLPQQEYLVNTAYDDGCSIAVEPWAHNQNPNWPPHQILPVVNGCIKLCNNTEQPIILSKDVKQIKISESTFESREENVEFERTTSPTMSSLFSNENYISDINISKNTDPKVRNLLDNAHTKYWSVFNKDLSEGYNDYYGVHRCQLNWAGNERPLANKVKVPNYKHELKGLQQDLMDDLTQQGVLLVPQEHDIIVQAVCPSFIQRKQKAKDKPQHLLTKDDIRLLINFGTINDKIKPIPTHVPKTNDVLVTLGRWKELITFDLHNGYFQIKMADSSIPWLGVNSPFGGLRVITRSGQGLLGQAEEFNEVLCKVLKEEMQEGICIKIVDDVYVGGKNQEDAAKNYIRCVEKLSKANLKISPSKTHIFPESVDLLGWVWEKGGRLKPSPHRQCALRNVKEEDVKKVKDMRSWIGLYKTLHIATPQISSILDPFETEVAGKDSTDNFNWNPKLSQEFRVAKNHVDKMKALYLPDPNDQLIMETDGSKMTPGIGHVLFALKDGKKIPVRFHTFKLKESCRKWSPCEIEALALAVGIEKEMDILRESTKPLYVYPDSKPVHQAIELINKGNFSSSARMSSFLANINRVSIVSKHISGRAKLNEIADLQSRAISECSAECCSIHRFVEDAIDGVVDNKDATVGKLAIAKVDLFNNRNAWKTAQANNQACGFAKHLLTTGKPPPRAVGKTAGEYFNEVRFYCREATVDKDGLLVNKTNPDPMSGNVSRHRIIVPKPLVQSLLWHLHNHHGDHPTKTQLKHIFQRGFHTMELDKHLDLLYNAC